MEFHIDMTGLSLDRHAIETAIHAVDPAALVDLDIAGHRLRIAAWVDAARLLLLINQAGYRVAPDRLSQIPSTCCGGCSG